MEKTKRISLGLQGGGAYGAFGWGVLDRLLADDRLDIVAISAASAGAIKAVEQGDGIDGAGAINAVALLDGFDGAGARGADGDDVQAVVGQQPVEHAPTEGAVRAAALQSKTDPFGLFHDASLV